jgi:hypothetical protein
MYAYTYEIEDGFFEGVCRLEDRPPTFRDPPPPQYVNWLWESRTNCPSVRVI